MVEHAIFTVDNTVKFEAVHAFKGKDLRAEPVAALYEQQRIIHVEEFETLEGQMVDWNPRETPDSPDRLDGLVWGLTELMCKGSAPTINKDFPKLQRRG